MMEGREYIFPLKYGVNGILGPVNYGQLWYSMTNSGKNGIRQHNVKPSDGDNINKIDNTKVCQIEQTKRFSDSSSLKRQRTDTSYKNMGKMKHGFGSGDENCPLSAIVDESLVSTQRSSVINNKGKQSKSEINNETVTISVNTTTLKNHEKQRNYSQKEPICLSTKADVVNPGKPVTVKTDLNPTVCQTLLLPASQESVDFSPPSLKRLKTEMNNDNASEMGNTCDVSGVDKWLFEENSQTLNEPKTSSALPSDKNKNSKDSYTMDAGIYFPSTSKTLTNCAGTAKVKKTRNKPSNTSSADKGSKLISVKDKEKLLKSNNDLWNNDNENKQNWPTGLTCYLCRRVYKLQVRLAVHLRDVHGHMDSLLPTGTGARSTQAKDEQPTEQGIIDLVSEEQIKKHCYTVVDTDSEEEDDENSDIGEPIVDISKDDLKPLEDEVDHVRLGATKLKYSTYFKKFLANADKLKLSKPEDRTYATLLKSINRDLITKLEPYYLRLILADQLSKESNMFFNIGALVQMLTKIIASIYKNTFFTKYKIQNKEEYDRVKEMCCNLVRRIAYSRLVPDLLKNLLEAFVKNLTVCAMERTTEAKRVIVSGHDVDKAALNYCELLVSQQYELPEQTIKKLKVETFRKVTCKVNYPNLVHLGIYEILRKHKILKLEDSKLKYIDFKKVPHYHSDMINLFRYLGECSMKNEYYKAMHEYMFRFVYRLAVQCITIVNAKYSHDQLYNTSSSTKIEFHYNDILKALRMLNISFFQNNRYIFHMNGIYRHLPFIKFDEELKNENAIVDHPERKYNNPLFVFGDVSQESGCNKSAKLMVKEFKAHYVKDILSSDDHRLQTECKL